MPVLTPAQGRSGRAAELVGTGGGKEGRGRTHHGRDRRERGSESKRSAAGWRAHTSVEWKKMNKHPAREMAGGPGARFSLFSLSLFFVLFPFSLLFSVVTLSQAISRLRFTIHRTDCSGGLLAPRAIPSTSNPRGPARELPLCLPSIFPCFPLALSLLLFLSVVLALSLSCRSTRLISRARTSIIRAL